MIFSFRVGKSLEFVSLVSAAYQQSSRLNA